MVTYIYTQRETLSSDEEHRQREKESERASNDPINKLIQNPLHTPRYPQLSNSQYLIHYITLHSRIVGALTFTESFQLLLQ